MSKKYWDERDKKAGEKTDELLNTLPDFVGNFEEYISERAALTRENYIRDISLFFDYITKELDFSSPLEITVNTLSSLSVDFLSSYSRHLSNYTKSGEKANMAPSTRCRRLSALRALYSYLYDTEQIPQNQMTKIHTPKIDTKEIIRLEDDEVDDLLSAITDGKGTESSERARIYNQIQALRDITIISMLLNTGMRVSELVGLDIEDLDLKRFSVRIIGKGHENFTTLYYNDDLRDLLLHYLSYRNRIEDVKEGSEKALFLSSRKSRIGVRAVENLVKKYSERAEIKRISPHKLRSTFATKLYSETKDIRAVADALNHKSIATTSKRYVESSKEVRKSNRDKVNYSTDIM